MVALCSWSCSCLSICLSIYLFIYLSIYLSMDGSIYLSIHPSTYLSFCLCFFLSFYLSIFLSFYLSIFLSFYSYSSICPSARLFCETSSIFELETIKNAAILRDFLSFWTWQRQKLNNSAKLPQFSKLTTSKTSNSARPPSIMESWVQSWRPRANAFCDCSSPCV